MARAYPIHEAKAKLSEILRRVKKGGSVTISDRGRAVARVVPIEPPSDVPSRLEELARDGALIRRRAAKRIQPLARRPGALRRFLRERG